jgi:hypothetical protein
MSRLRPAAQRPSGPGSLDMTRGEAASFDMARAGGRSVRHNRLRKNFSESVSPGGIERFADWQQGGEDRSGLTPATVSFLSENHCLCGHVSCGFTGRRLLSVRPCVIVRASSLLISSKIVAL